MTGMQAFVRGLKTGFNGLGLLIQTVVNTILLSIVYLIGIGLTSLIAHARKKRFLSPNEKAVSHWRELGLGKKPAEKYYRQF